MLTKSIRKIIAMTSYSALAINAFASDDEERTVEEQVEQGVPVNNASEPETKK